MEEIWSNRPYVALALSSLLSTCVVFWSHRRRDIGYTAVIFLPERMYIILDSSACTSYPYLKRHKCLWRFGKATGLRWLSSFLLSQSFFSSQNWSKSGITKKPAVFLYLYLFIISLLAIPVCTVNSLMPGVNIFCRTVFCVLCKKHAEKNLKFRVRLTLMHVHLYKTCMYAYNMFAFLLISLPLLV